MSTPRVPNFFLVGAPKAGTTSLWRYLDQHPDIFMSRIKEPSFFAPESGHRELVPDWSGYLRLFEPARNESAIGEASVSYLASEDAPQAIHDRLPNARILMMLRDPADRLFAHYTAARAAAVTTDAFPAWLEAQRAAEASRQPRIGPVWAGRYAEHLRRYLAVFPQAQVQIHVFEDYAATPADTLARIFTFLGVDAAHRIDLARRYNVTMAPRWPQLHQVIRPAARVLNRIAPRAVVESMRRPLLARFSLSPAPEERAQALALYADDIRTLETLLHRPLPGWLALTRPPRPAR